MSLIALAIYDTPENGRAWMTRRCLDSIEKTVDLKRHNMTIVINGSHSETIRSVYDFKFRHDDNVMVLMQAENIGQAAAINKAWQYSYEGPLARIDNDVELTTPGWLELLQECIERDPKLGIASIKHADLSDCPEQSGWLKTSYHTLPHEKGQRHLIVERVNHCLGAVQLINRALFDKIGYLDSFTKYGWEDSLYARRCELAGFYSAYCHIGHFVDLDQPKVESYQTWKNMEAENHRTEHDQRVAEYRADTRPLYVEAS